jgi:transposase
MTRMTLRRDDVVVGVDTHKDEHAAVLLDGLGGTLTELVVPATTDGFAQLLSVAVDRVGPAGRLVAFGVEGTGSYGLGLARFLRRQGYQVREVNRPPRKDQRRLTGKSDLLDAEHAAREVLTGAELATPKTADGSVESLRLLKVARDTAVTAHSQAMITLKATLVTASDALRAELEPRTDFALVTACAELAVTGELADPEVAMRHALRALARRWLALHEEIKLHTRQLKTLTNKTAPALVATFGIGFDSAAELLCAAGDNTARIRSEAAYAKLCGACPIPASSGKTTRHRLNRGGNRQANAALFRIVVVRLRWHPPTIAYAQRRTAEGLSKREIIRCLKRYVAREVFRLLPAPAATPTQSLQAA